MLHRLPALLASFTFVVAMPAEISLAQGGSTPMTSTDPVSFNPFDPAFRADPYPAYARLREADPVHRSPLGFVVLTRYADVQACYRDPAIFTSDKTVEFGAKFGPTPLGEHHTTSLVFNDPPLHTRVRRLIAGALTPRHIAAMEQRLIERVDSLLDVMSARDRGAAGPTAPPEGLCLTGVRYDPDPFTSTDR